MRYLRSYWFVLSLASLVAGCALLGLEKAETFNDKLGYAVGLQAETLRFVSAKADAGVMTGGEADQIIAQVELAHKGAQEARTVMAAGDTATAEGKLRFAIAALEAAHRYAKER